MNKKLIIICLGLTLIVAALLFISFSPNTVPSPETQLAHPAEPIKKEGSPPPPPPSKSNSRRVTAPPPPPRGFVKNNRKAEDLPEGYIKYEVVEQPEPILQLKPGSTKLLSLNVKKGSEDFKIEWFKKGKGTLKKVNIGNTFSVSPAETVVYYMATIDDNVSVPQNIFFQVEPDENAEVESSNKKTLTNAKNKVKEPKPIVVIPPPSDTEKPIDTKALAKTAEPTIVKKSEEKPEPVVTKKAEQESTPEAKKPTSVANKKYTITPTSNTEVTAAAKTPLKIGFNIEGEPGYKIFWFHKPFGKSKGSLIKKRTTPNFSLKRLNKYHSGYFYIQVKDKAGKFYKSPEYKVTVQ